jgi:hypothetical protein
VLGPPQAASPGQGDARLGWRALGLLAAAVVLSRALASGAFPLYDDAFITYRYSANLAEGRGLVYNPQASWEPVLGTTTPAYALILAAALRLGLPLPGASLVLNYLCDGLSALMLGALLGGRARATCAAVLLFGAFPWIARISVGGMEAPLFLCTCLAAVLAAERGWLASAAASAGLAVWVRPEAVLLASAIVLWRVRSRASALRVLLPLATIGGVGVWLLTRTFGSPIPQSVRAKAQTHGLGLRLFRFEQTLEQAFYPGLWTLALLPVVVWGFARARRERSALRLFLGIALAMVAAYLLAGAKTWGWYFYAPLVAWCVALALGLERLAERAFGGRPARGMRWAALTAVASVAASLCTARLWPDRVTGEVYGAMRQLGRELAAERAAGERVLASDIGAIGYFTGLEVLDSEGLVWPPAKQAFGQVALIREHRPRYVMLVAHNPWVRDFLSDPISKEYRAVRRFRVGDDGPLDPDPATLGDTWVQDYLFYQRLP